MPTTEQDLRDALTRHVDDEIAGHDAAQFRAALLDSLGMPQPPLAPVGVFEISTDEPHPAPGRGRLAWLIAAVAACFVFGVAGVVALTGSDGSAPTGSTRPSTSPVPALPRQVPARIREAAYPGTMWMSEDSSDFPMTIGTSVPLKGIPAQYEWIAYVTCSRDTDVAISDRDGRTVSHCKAASFVRVPLPPAPAKAYVDVEQGIRWDLFVMVSPQPRTNGAVVGADAPVQANGSPGQVVTAQDAAGHGDGTVRIDHPKDLSTGPDGLTMTLTCSGSGVSIAGFDPDVSGGAHQEAYTHTCFPGFAYRWTTRSLERATTLQVHASDATTWEITVGG